MMYFTAHVLQSRKICCLEVQVVEKKKKKKEKKSSKVISPSAIFNWCANIMSTIGLIKNLKALTNLKHVKSLVIDSVWIFVTSFDEKTNMCLLLCHFLRKRILL